VFTIDRNRRSRSTGLSVHDQTESVFTIDRNAQPKDTLVAIQQTSGRQRLNIHGAIDLETRKTRMIEAVTVNAISTIMLMRAIETMYPGKRLIHLFLDNARYGGGDPI
jgi:hypothetical protein